jgi:integrase
LRRIHVQSFLDDLEQSGVTAETWNKYLVPIKTVLKRAGNPAAREVLAKDAETVYRQPFSLDELQAIFEAAQRTDPLMYSLAVTAACTAMRRKDCCYLKWSDVDLEAGFITVKTSKTGATVDIPLANMLQAEIIAQDGNGSPYVFPNAQKLYKANPSALSERFKKVLEVAGFDCGALRPPVEFKSDPCTVKELHKAAAEFCRTDEKLDRVKAVAETYLAGNSLRETAKAEGLSVASVSLYLNELEAATGKAIIRGKRRESQKPVLPAPTRGAVRKERENGILSASVRDFHSFRTTFVTLALMAGMPLDIVRKITGHKAAEVVMKHYFRPEREQLRAAMQKALPGLLSSSSNAAPYAPAERAVNVLEGANAKNWRKTIDEAISILKANA